MYVLEIIDIEEIRLNTYKIIFNNNKEITVYAPNIKTAIKRAYDLV